MEKDMDEYFGSFDGMMESEMALGTMESEMALGTMEPEMASVRLHVLSRVGLKSRELQVLNLAY